MRIITNLNRSELLSVVIWFWCFKKPEVPVPPLCKEK